MVDGEEGCGCVFAGEGFEAEGEVVVCWDGGGGWLGEVGVYFVAEFWGEGGEEGGWW